MTSRTKGLTLSLAKIPLLVDSPAGYLVALRQKLAEQYGDWPGRSAIVREIGRTSKKRATRWTEWSSGANRSRWNRIIIQQLVDREWLDSEYNELDSLIDFIDPSRNLAGAKHVLVAGAGLCRIADPLCISSVDSVTCTDLSWEMLYFGRELLAGRHRNLPTEFGGPRLFFEIENGRFKKKTRRLAFGEPSTRISRSKIRFAVTDAFAIDRSLEKNVLVAPYLLDAFTGDECETLLIRLGQQLGLGQSIVIVMSLTAGRLPDVVVRGLRATGFDVDTLKLHPNLPYSFSRVDFGFVRQERATILVRATKTRLPVAKKIRLSLNLSPSFVAELKRTKMRAVGVDGSGAPSELSSTERNYLLAASESANCAQFAEQLSPRAVSADVTETALACLTSKGLLRLSGMS